MTVATCGAPRRAAVVAEKCRKNVALKSNRAGASGREKKERIAIIAKVGIGRFG